MLEITTKNAEPLKLVKAPFASERELEDYLFAHPEELGLKAYIARQYRLPGGGVVDLIGVDSDERIAVVEVKNCPADAHAVTQAASYAALIDESGKREIEYLARLAGLDTGGVFDPVRKTRPTAKEKADALRHTRNYYWVRTIVAATAVKPEAVRLARALSYIVEFYAVSRYRGASRSRGFLVEKLSYEREGKGAHPGKRRRSDADSNAIMTPPEYAKRYRPDIVEEFFRRTEELEKYVARRKWPLSLTYRTEYSAFKTDGGRRVFGVRFGGALTVVYYFCLPKKEASKLSPPREPMRNYYENNREAWFTITPGKTKLGDFKKLLEAAHKGAEKFETRTERKA